MTRSEWHGRAFFAEIAEALDVSTDQVLGAYQTEHDGLTVIYTTEDAGLRAWRALLGRDEGGIMRVAERQELDAEWLKDVLR